MSMHDNVSQAKSLLLTALRENAAPTRDMQRLERIIAEVEVLQHRLKGK